MAKSKANEILRAEKERDFRRAIEGIEGFVGWKQGKGSHVKAVFQAGGDENKVESAPPYAAHHGEVSKGVRRSIVKWLKNLGLIIFLLAFGYLVTLVLALAR